MSEAMSTQPRERPILMSAPMVRAILAGRKTQTRRIVSAQNSRVSGETRGKLWDHLHFDHGTGAFKDRGSTIFGCGPDCDHPHVPAWHPDEPGEILSYRVRPVYAPGSLLWVKETFAIRRDGTVSYRADGPKGSPYGCLIDDPSCRGAEDCNCKWRPSIFMPRAASRLTLEITEVRVQRLQEIGAEDCIAEGIYSKGAVCNWGSVKAPKETYRELWESINGPGSWAQNPYVWAISFRRSEI